MIRQSISLTEPNITWLDSLVESEEYTSRSEIINALIRKERNKQKEIERIRAILTEAENSGFVDATPETIRDEILAEMRDNGEL